MRTRIGRILICLALWPTLQGQETLLETGSFVRDGDRLASPIRLVSYNIHGPFTRRFEAVAEALEEHPRLGDSALFALQEVNRNRSESGHKDIASELAQRLGMHYVYAVELQYENGDGERGLAMLSPYPIRDPVRIVLPGRGPRGRRRIALGATLGLSTGDVRVYNLHLETRISVSQRRRQVEAVLERAAAHSHMPVVILGDFNTFHPGARAMMFEVMEEAGFHCPLRADKPTFKTKLVLRLKLDWIWVRGIDPIDADVEGKVTASDHRPLWVTFDQNDPH